MSDDDVMLSETAKANLGKRGLSSDLSRLLVPGQLGSQHAGPRTVVELAVISIIGADRLTGWPGGALSDRERSVRAGQGPRARTPEGVFIGPRAAGRAWLPAPPLKRTRSCIRHLTLCHRRASFEYRFGDSHCTAGAVHTSISAQN